MVIPSCSYYQLQLCIGPRDMMFGDVKQSTIYVKYVERSCKKVFKKQKIMPWLTEHDDVVNVTPTRGRQFLLGPGTADCAPKPLVCVGVQYRSWKKIQAYNADENFHEVFSFLIVLKRNGERIQCINCSLFELPEIPSLFYFSRWRSVYDLTKHAISGLCLDGVIVLS